MNTDRISGIGSLYYADTQTIQQEEVPGASFSDVYQEKMENSGSEEMDAIFEEAAATYGISVQLLKSVAKAESNFNPSAVSHAGAIGVMQLMPGTAKSLGVTDPYDARQNIMGGAKYLKQNLDKFGDVGLALAAYNAGPGSVEKYGGVPPYAETQNYVGKVLAYMGGDTLYANRTVTSSSTDQNTLAALYSMGSAGLSSVGSLYGMDNSYGLNSLYGLNSSYGLNSMYGLGSYGLGSTYGLSSMYGLSSYGLYGLGSLAVSQDGDTITMDKKSYASLVEILRLQMMMNASQSVGMITI